ncbi:MAG: hypothetical protein LUQ12_02370, partial [Methanoregulaceae archaeon]|nr:hypothetical protein [Methanoregulaceae archaeon]
FWINGKPFRQKKIIVLSFPGPRITPCAAAAMSRSWDILSLFRPDDNIVKKTFEQVRRGQRFSPGINVIGLTLFSPLPFPSGHE